MENVGKKVVMSAALFLAGWFVVSVLYDAGLKTAAGFMLMANYPLAAIGGILTK